MAGVVIVPCLRSIRLQPSLPVRCFSTVLPTLLEQQHPSFSSSSHVLTTSLLRTTKQSLIKNGRGVIASPTPIVSVRNRWKGRDFSMKASESGSIDSPMIRSMESKIKEQLNADQVIVRDAYGDGRHVSIDVISAAFEGQNAVTRQRMVYKAIWEELQTTVHAVDQMSTRTPSEAASK